MSKLLPVLCPQEYHGLTMTVSTCSRCSTGWDKEAGKCNIATGATHLPDDAPPECPISSRCQHQIQNGDVPCEIRSKGLVCESALRFAGDPHPENSPIGFNAYVCATAEELAR